MEKQLLVILKEFNKWLNRYWYEPHIYKSDILKEWEEITKDIKLEEKSPEMKFIIKEKEREVEMRQAIDKQKRLEDKKYI